MKLSVECNVESKIKLHEVINIKNNDNIYVFYPDHSGMLHKIKIITKVKRPEKFYARMKPTPNAKSAFSIKIRTDVELGDSIKREFQRLESEISFSTKGCLKKIYWDDPKSE
ncbi:MAG: hypothetical protein HWN67_20115, partial [Candidatus Helarchaeota archaeon]|nr:hypothetical protein [Candidatus Helarchaeota archaeon]